MCSKRQDSFAANKLTDEDREHPQARPRTPALRRQGQPTARA